MGWLCLFPRRLALDALLLEDPEGVAVTERSGSHHWVVASRPPVFPGIDVATVMSARPELRCIEADHRAEAMAIEQLATLAHGLGSPVHLEHALPCRNHPLGQCAVWVEVGRSERLFGGNDAVLAAAREGLQELPLDCGLAIAPTLEGARLAAQLSDGTIIRTREALREWLEDIPVHVLPMPLHVREGLHASGVSHGQGLLSLPTDQLARRFGASTTQYLDRLLGRSQDPRLPHRLPPCFEQRIRFDSGVQYVEGLGFPLRRLYGALGLYLRAEDKATRHVRVVLKHEEAPDTILDVALSTPAQDADYWLLMTRERLARLELPAPVVELCMRCKSFTAMEAPQLDLFDTGRSQADAWRQTVERLVARLGVEAVWRMGLAEDHRPEHAWTRLPIDDGDGDSEWQPPADRPVWLFDPPRPLAQPPAITGAPERIESGWWDGRDTRRDYYTARSAQGERMWVFQDRTNKHWYLHGLWA